MTSLDTESIVFTELDEAMTPDCDYHGEPACGGGKAEWIMFAWCDICEKGRHGFACTGCKDARLSESETWGVECVGCHMVTIPARHAYTRIEPI